MKTPRTDRNERIVLGGVGGDWKVVTSDFARQLERELNLALWKLAGLTGNEEEARRIEREGLIEP